MVGTNRCGRRAVWTLGAAAIACAAGTAYGQRGANDDWWAQYQHDAEPADRGAEPGARRFDGETIYLEQSVDDREVVLRLRNGRVAARLDGRGVPRDRIEIRGDRVRVLDEFGDTAAVFRIPPAAMRQAQMDRQERRPRPAEPFRRARPEEQRLRAIPGEDTRRFHTEEPWLEGLTTLLREQMLALEHPPVVVGILMAPAEGADLAGADEYTRGVRIEQTLEGLPAAEAGLRKGDIIVAVDGQTDIDADGVRRVLREKSPGQTVSFTILRDGREEDVKVTLEPFDARELSWDFVTPPGVPEGGRAERQTDDAATEEPGRPVLGVSISEAPEEAFAEVEEYDEGVVVQELRDGLPAAKAGLKQGDIIVEFDGEKVGSPAVVQEMVARAQPGETVVLTIIRDGAVRKISVPLGTSE